MVHGIRGDEAARRAWVQLTDDLLGGQSSEITGLWRSMLDAAVALHHGDAEAAVAHLAVDVDDPDTWWHGATVMYRPWYAAVWAEAAVLAARADALTRVERARWAARANPVATAVSSGRRRSPPVIGDAVRGVGGDVRPASPVRTSGSGRPSSPP